MARDVVSSFSEFRRVAVLSTEHLPAVCQDGDWPIGIVAYRYEEGFLLWVPDAPTDPDNLAHQENAEEGQAYARNYEALLRIQVEARAAGCDYVMFDNDGPVQTAFPTFDDEEG